MTTIFRNNCSKMLKIDRNTRYEDFRMWEPLLADGMADAIRKAAVRNRFGVDGFWNMTLGDMFSILAGDMTRLTWGVSPDSVFGVYINKAFSSFMEDFIGKLKSLTLPPTQDAMQASQGCLNVAFDESVYVFCREYFGLHGFEAVEGLKVADFIMAKKDAYNKAVVDRNVAAAIKKGARK